MEQLYPIAISLKGRRCLVIGGGSVAARRIRGLVDCGAAITVVAPSISEEIRHLADAGKVELRICSYSSVALDDAILVFAATDDSEVNARIAGDSEAVGILCCNTSDSEIGSFIVPSTVRQGRL